MWLFLLAVHTSSSAPPRQLPDRFTTSVQTPFGLLPKGFVYAFCFSKNTRIGTVTSANSFLKVFKDLQGKVYSKRPHTTLTLKTDATLRGSPQSTFTLVVEGGTLDGVYYPTKVGVPNTKVGNRYLVSYNVVLPPQYQAVPNTWPANTALIQASIQLDPDEEINPGEAVELLEESCAQVDFTTP